MSIAETSPERRGGSLLDASVIGAMGVAAIAFAAGLVVKSNIGLLPSVIAAFALFMVMASSHVVMRRAWNRPPAAEAPAYPFHASLPEPVFDIGREQDLDLALSRIDQIDARLSRLEDMAESEQTLGDIGARLAWLERMAGSAERADSRVDAMRTQLQIEARERDDALKSEVHVLEALVKQVAEEVAAVRDNAQAAAPHQSEKDVRLEWQNEPAAESAPRVVPLTERTLRPMAVPDHQSRIVDAELLEVVRQSIEYNKVELFLQPIVTLPQRTPVHYEALTRLRTRAGDLVLPRDYIRVAEPAGMMPLIDNVMLFRSVQVLKRLADKQQGRGVFCNISLHSLLDPDFFPEFVSFMEQNRALNDTLYFEFAQDFVSRLGPVEMENLATLAELGFGFSLDHVTDLDIDFAALNARGFRFVKVEARTFCDGMRESGARIHPADMNAYLSRFGIDLVVEKIEDERAMGITLAHGVRLGQGYLFSEPKPVRAEVFRDEPGADAA